MRLRKRDFSIFGEFKFERKPVGIYYSLSKPEGVEQLDKSLALCELFAEAQTRPPFYATEENIQCGEHVLGFADFPPIMYSGQLGPEFAMFKNPAANRKVYDYVPILEKDSVKYITCTPLDQLTVDPDLFIITANTGQAEILLRACSFSNGKMWTSKGSSCLACAWLFAYPYLSGEMNFTVSGLGYSMKARGVLPDGLLLLAIPGEQLSNLIENLQDMEWYPHWFKLGREGFIEGVKALDEKMIRRIYPKQ